MKLLYWIIFSLIRGICRGGWEPWGYRIDQQL